MNRRLWWINLWLAGTNVLVLPTLMTSSLGDARFFLALAVATASTLMHLGETKHGLPGIAPFADHSRALLNLDRVVAVVAALVIAHRNMYRHDLWVQGIVGVVCMMVSEWKRTPLAAFVILHTAWHCAVYSVLFSAR